MIGMRGGSDKGTGKEKINQLNPPIAGERHGTWERRRRTEILRPEFRTVTNHTERERGQRERELPEAAERIKTLKLLNLANPKTSPRPVPGQKQGERKRVFIPRRQWAM